MAKKNEEHWDSVGWVFYSIWFVLLVGPCIYGLLQFATERTNELVPVGAGVVLAAIAAGFVAWIVNSILQYLAKRRRIVVRKKARKK